MYVLRWLGNNFFQYVFIKILECYKKILPLLTIENCFSPLSIIGTK